MNTTISLLLIATCLLSACKGVAPQQDRFALADANQDNKLSRKEASDAVVTSIMRAYDTNKDGSLTLAEWKEHDDSADAKLFAQRDTDNSGTISLAEAQANADRQNIFGDTFKKADKDGDKLLSRDEAAAYTAAKEGPVR